MTTRLQIAAALRKVARQHTMPTWGGENHYWPRVDRSWDEEYVQTDRFGDVHVMAYALYGHAVSPKVTVDTGPWIHKNRPEFSYSIELQNKKVKEGKIPLKDYERAIPKLLADAVKLADAELAKISKQLDAIKVPNWDIWYDKSSDDLIADYKAPDKSEYSDSSMTLSVMSPLNMLTGNDTASYSVHYSKGADYEGHYGVAELDGHLKSLSDLKKALRDAEALWKKQEAKS